MTKERSFLLVLPTIVIAEYLTAQEVETEEGYAKSKQYLSLYTQQDLTMEIAEELGKILRRKTFPQSANLGDLIVAATAICLNASLVTRNKADFIGIPGLELFDPSKL